jgi:soluble P-type ATPase
MGATIAFEQVSVEVAQALRRDLISDIERIGEKIVPVGLAAADMAPMLLHNNLISGVIDAHNWTL